MTSNPNQQMYFAVICNGTAYIDECGICIIDSNEVDNNSEKSESFKLQLNIE